METKRETFTYTYSAKQQEEIDKIRKKYLPPEEDKMAQLRRLDQSATKKGTMISIIIGVIGTLLMGVGMCCSMVGIGGVAAAYPVYSRITKKERERLAPQILKLTEELTQAEG